MSMHRVRKTENLRVSIYPWDLRSWRSAFRIAGLPGYALLALLLGAMIQYLDITGVGGGAGHASASSLLLIRTPMCLGAFILLLYQPRIASLRLKDSGLLFLAFGSLYFVSTLWSAVRIETLGKAVEILLATFCFLEVSRYENAQQRVDALRQIVLLTISAISLFTVVGFCLHLPNFSLANRGLFLKDAAQSPFLSGNGLGYVSVALFLVIFAEWQGGRIRFAPASRQMAFALLLFCFAASRTSFAILLVSVAIVVARRSKVLGIAVIAVISALIAVFQGGVLDYLHGTEAGSNFTTLSGRTIVWTAAIRQWQQHPWLGLGGGVGGKIVLAHINSYSFEILSSLHNGFMELLTGLGVVGVLLGVYLLLLVTWRTFRAWKLYPEHSGTYVLIVHVWACTIMSTGIFGWMGYEMMIFLCLVTTLDLLRRKYAPTYSPVPEGELVLVES
ncbi:MAG TPA: O-antigen ligase family protein [Acidobacteriaceae bacterium]|nr:O-antigen ligase family protein [Acidobacteriaceae bacterium]